MKAQLGWTLIELAVVLAILGIVGGVSASGLSSALESSRSVSAQAALLDSLQTAALRATLAGNRGVLCPTLDGRNCSDGPDWSAGWLVFMDGNGNREFDGGESLLRRERGLPGKVRLRSTSGRTRIVFQANGGNAGSNVTFTLCDGRGPARARALIMSNTGGLRDGEATAANIAATCPP